MSDEDRDVANDQGSVGKLPNVTGIGIRGESDEKLYIANRNRMRRCIGDGCEMVKV